MDFLTVDELATAFGNAELGEHTVYFRGYNMPGKGHENDLEKRFQSGMVKDKETGKEYMGKVNTPLGDTFDFAKFQHENNNAFLFTRRIGDEKTPLFEYIIVKASAKARKAVEFMTTKLPPVLPVNQRKFRPGMAE